MSKNKTTKKSFKACLIFKSLLGFFDVLSGLTLIFINPVRLTKMINFITAKEFSGDPVNWIMNYIIRFSYDYTAETRHFMIYYLILQGLINIIVVVLLWKKIMWVYPLSIAMYIGMVAYEFNYYSGSHSLLIAIFIAIDIVTIYFIVQEYRSSIAGKGKGIWARQQRVNR